MCINKRQAVFTKAAKGILYAKNALLFKGRKMIYLWNIKTDEIPVEQREIIKLVERGHEIDLILDHKKTETDNNFFLYIKYRDKLRPVFTQRNTHKSYSSIERAVEWGKRIGFRWLILNVNYKFYVQNTEEAFNKELEFSNE